MEGRYKVTFEINMFEDQKYELDFHLSETIGKIFDVFPENLKAERILSEAEKTIMKEKCINHQAVDQYCEECEEGCIGCQKRWLRQLGWEERDLPEKPFPLLGDRFYTLIHPSCKD